MRYYQSIFALIGLLFVLCAGLFASTTAWTRSLREAFSAESSRAQNAAAAAVADQRLVRLRDRAVTPLREFTRSWQTHLSPAGQRELGNHVRNSLTTLATRTGLTSEGATVPAEPRSYAAGGSVIRVQQVSLNVVSESLPAVITWLGAVEEQFPYARVEGVTVSGYASRSVQLALTILHPVDDSSPTPMASIANLP